MVHTCTVSSSVQKVKEEAEEDVGRGLPHCLADLLLFTRRGRTVCLSGSTWQPLVSSSCESLRWLSMEVGVGGGSEGTSLDE